MARNALLLLLLFQANGPRTPCRLAAGRRPHHRVAQFFGGRNLARYLALFLPPRSEKSSVRGLNARLRLKYLARGGNAAASVAWASRRYVRDRPEIAELNVIS